MAFPAIHDLAAAVRRLNDIDHQPIPEEERTEEQDGILALMEIMQYRLVSTSLRNLQESLNPRADAALRIADWVHEFEKRVEHVFPTFSKLTDWDKVTPDFELVYRKPLQHSLRSQMIEAILEQIMCLAPGRFNQPDSTEVASTAFRSREAGPR